jgi:hypothetical protein
MDPIYTFGYKLAELTHQKEFAGVGLLCLAIKDSGREFKNLGYDDFKTVILEHLPKRLDKMILANRQQVIAEMLKLLNQNQSIINLSSH